MNLQKFADQLNAHQKHRENPDVVVTKLIDEEGTNREYSVVQVDFIDGRIEIVVI